MPSVINSDNGVVSGSAGLKTSGANDGLLNLQTNGSTAMSVNASQQVTFNNGVNLPNTFGFKNRIINGGMVIDQRNAGASVTPINTQYLVDRFSYLATQASKFTAQQNAGSVTPPTGFSNYLGMTVAATQALGASDFFGVSQKIEGFNTADLGWGAAGAQAATLSFWVRSSLTGTFGGSLRNSAGNRSYVFSYAINSANTWEQKTVVVAGDTSGTWLTNNGIGIDLFFSLGVGSTFSGSAGSWSGSNLLSATGAVSVVGTNGATFYITGVQLERGSTATSFDFRPYGTELALCQRYYFRNTADQTFTVYGAGQGVSGTLAIIYAAVPVSMRASPTVTGSTLRVFSGTAGFNVTGFDLGFVGRNVGSVGINVASGLTAGQGYYLQANSSTAAFIDYSAEL